MTSTEVDRPRSRLATAAIYAAGFVALLWIIEILDVATGESLERNGIRPLSLDGLWGILFAPLLHDNWAHLISNTAPTFVLCFVIVLTSGTRLWFESTGIIWVIAGIGTWLTGGINSNHIGASSLVFGWVAFLVLRGIFARHFGQIVVGVVIAAVYGYLIWGVLPTTPGVSWQGHLFGAVGGLVAAVVLGRRAREQKRPISA